jgi:hypothetical protein
MSAVLAPARRRRSGARSGSGPGRQDALFGAEGAHDRLEAPPTLDDVVSRGWEGLRAGVAMACPVCQGDLAPDAGGGRCERCGSTLA